MNPLKLYLRIHGGERGRGGEGSRKGNGGGEGVIGKQIYPVG